MELFVPGWPIHYKSHIKDMDSQERQFLPLLPEKSTIRLVPSAPIVFGVLPFLWISKFHVLGAFPYASPKHEEDDDDRQHGGQHNLPVHLTVGYFYHAPAWYCHIVFFHLMRASLEKATILAIEAPAQGVGGSVLVRHVTDALDSHDAPRFSLASPINNDDKLPGTARSSIRAEVPHCRILHDGHDDIDRRRRNDALFPCH